MEVLVAALILSVGIAGETVPKYPKISSIFHLKIPCLKYDVVESNLKLVYSFAYQDYHMML